VARSRTQHSSLELGEILRAIERAAGRQRTDPARCELDLDLLFYGGRVDAAQRLPRPGVLALPYVLRPLAELAPELVHPVTGERVETVWRRAADDELARLGPIESLA
jgi:2-amino-4-hydroxy-6-hydroxymethyldihydropteridine diphosphokinase